MSAICKVPQGAARKLLTELGQTNGRALSGAKLALALKKLPSQLDDDEELDLSVKSKRLLKQVMEAGEEKLKIVIESEDDEEESPRKKVSAKAKGKKVLGKAKTKAKGPRKEAANKDKFGSREDTECALINAEITKKGITVERLVDKFPKMRKGRVRSHLRFLEERDYVRLKDDKVYEK